MSRLFDDASTQYLTYAGAVVTDGPATLAAWFNTDDGGGSIAQPILGVRSSTTNRAMRIVLYNGDLYAQKGVGVESALTGTYSANTWHHAVGTFNSGTGNMAVYLDGGGKVTAAGGTVSSINTTRIGRVGFSGDNEYFSGRIAEAAIWNVVLTDAEVAVLAEGVSPLLVRPQSLVMYVPLVRDNDKDIVGGIAFTATNSPTVGAHPRVIYPGVWQVGAPSSGGGGATYTLTCDAGGYTVNGQAVTLLMSRLLSANAGSYTVTGQDVSLVVSRLLTADAGSYMLAGQDASLLRSLLLTAEAGTYNVTGQTASLLASRKITADTGSYSITGQAATLLASRLLSAATGSYTLTGRDATLTYNSSAATYTLAFDTGTYAISGQTAQMLVSRLLTVDAGVYTLTGQDASLLRTLLLAADAGSYVVAGQDATLLRNLVLNADAGTYNVTGQDADLLTSRLLTLDAGAYVLTGQDANIARQYIMQADAGSYTVTGQAATLLASRLLSLATGSYAVSGQTVTLAYTGTSTPTPSDRIFVIPTEGRIFVVLSEDRTYPVQ